MTTSEMWARLSDEHQRNVFSSINVYYTGKELQHDPTSDELIRHYYFNHIPYQVLEYEVEEVIVNEALTISKEAA